jgi:hypothetical protein
VPINLGGSAVVPGTHEKFPLPTGAAELRIGLRHQPSEPGMTASQTRSVLQEGRQNANIDAGLGFIWRISVKTSSFPLDLNGSAIAVGAGRPAAGSVLLERPAGRQYRRA